MKTKYFIDFFKKKPDRLYILVGVAILILCYIFCLFMGEEMIVNVHNQLDGENVYPELFTEQYLN